MLQTRLFLSCDGDGCAKTLPASQGQMQRTVDARQYSATSLRVDAALGQNWLHLRGRDYCPDCVFLYRLREQKPKGGKR